MIISKFFSVSFSLWGEITNDRYLRGLIIKGFLGKKLKKKKIKKSKLCVNRSESDFCMAERTLFSGVTFVNRMALLSMGFSR